ncbi:MAG: hypothetical protein HYV90_02660 [Candidatus Woesebacteria bacterium]|nr:MAG: hypothetical protein HYV90_02660 [Candidatus Woesebacteria bacterium]
MKKLGFLQALGVVLYCSLIGIFFWQGSKIFPEPNLPFGPIIMLLLLSTSVLICGLIVFYKPYKLFFEGKKTEAIKTVAYTAFWLFLFLFLSLLLMVVFK